MKDDTIKLLQKMAAEKNIKLDHKFVEKMQEIMVQTGIKLNLKPPLENVQELQQSNNSASAINRGESLASMSPKSSLTAKQQGKLQRYLKNSSRFLWGLGPGNQGKNYEWLDYKGYRNAEGQRYKGSYSNVTNDLLTRHGIEGIIKDLIVPTVKERLGDKADNVIKLLRSCWQEGVTPDMSLLKLNKIEAKNAEPFFLEINTQFNYVEKWGELAGIWFEEIEPLLDS